MRLTWRVGSSAMYHQFVSICTWLSSV